MYGGKWFKLARDHLEWRCLVECVLTFRFSYEISCYANWQMACMCNEQKYVPQIKKLFMNTHTYAYINNNIQTNLNIRGRQNTLSVHLCRAVVSMWTAFLR